jgi:hypothetical protein
MIKNHPYQVTTDAIAQLSVAAASDRDMVANLMATDVKLTLQLDTSQGYVKKLKEDIAQLEFKNIPLVKANDQPRRWTKITIVGPMGIRCYCTYCTLDSLSTCTYMLYCVPYSLLSTCTLKIAE